MKWVLPSSVPAPIPLLNAACKRACVSYAGCMSLSYEASANNCQLAAYNSKANALLLSSANLLNGVSSSAMVTDVVCES